MFRMLLNCQNNPDLVHKDIHVVTQGTIHNAEQMLGVLGFLKYENFSQGEKTVTICISD